MYRLLACSLLFLIFSPAAYACTCGKLAGMSDQELVESEKVSAHSVFVGRVVKILKDRDKRGMPTGGYIAVFRVSEVWKGSISRRIKLFTNYQCCLCIFGFLKGKEYLVYAYQNEDAETGESYLDATICSRTKETKDDEIRIDRQYLGISQKVKKN